LDHEFAKTPLIDLPFPLEKINILIMFAIVMTKTEINIVLILVKLETTKKSFCLILFITRLNDLIVIIKLIKIISAFIHPKTSVLFVNFPGIKIYL